MALIECPDCHQRVSERAPHCPSCGYPIAGIKQSSLNDKAKTGCAVFALLAILAAIGFFFYVLHLGDENRAKEAANPTCMSDWRKCSDNAEIANKYDDWFSARYDCERAAVKAAKYGEPKLPPYSFGKFLRGNETVKTGVAILVEDDAQFKNGFNASVKSSVRCTYDLKSKSVTDIKISAN